MRDWTFFCTLVHKSGPVTHVICYTKPLWSFDCGCDNSWLLVSLLLCLFVFRVKDPASKLFLGLGRIMGW